MNEDPVREYQTLQVLKHTHIHASTCINVVVSGFLRYISCILKSACGNLFKYAQHFLFGNSANSNLLLETVNTYIYIYVKFLNLSANVCASRQTHFVFSKFVRQTPVFKRLLPLANDLLLYLLMHIHIGMLIFICIFIIP